MPSFNCLYKEFNVLNEKRITQILFLMASLSVIIIVVLIFVLFTLSESNSKIEDIDIVVSNLEKNNVSLSESASKYESILNDLNTWMLYAKNDYLRKTEFVPLLKNVNSEISSLNENVGHIYKNLAYFYQLNENNNFNLPTVNQDVFAIYSSLPDAMGIELGAYILIPSNISLYDKLKVLSVKLTNFIFKKGIEVVRIEDRKKQKIAIINLLDKPSSSYKWKSSFQGSTGGGFTTSILKKTFLQPNSKYKWIDGVEFLLNGKPIVDENHTALSGTHFRSHLQ